MKLLFPRGDTDRLTGVLLNTAGGVTGGDCLTLRAGSNSGSRLCITTQAAERIYRAQPGEVGQIDNRLTIESGGRLDWLPQETILFDNGALNRRLLVDMAPDASFLAVESLILGRSAMGETLTATNLTDQIRVRRGNELVFADTLRLTNDTLPHLGGPAMLGRAGALATILFIAPSAEAQMPHLRKLVTSTGGMSLIRPGVLFARFLARDGFDLRTAMIPVLHHLNEKPLPRTWMI